MKTKKKQFKHYEIVKRKTPQMLNQPIRIRIYYYIVHDKSSSLGDPLTEPGEYENLPFHGLQTAPNKVQFKFAFFVYFFN